MDSVMVLVAILGRMLSRIGPYAIVEIVLPGGTLLALLLYWYRRQAGLKYWRGRMSIRRPPERL